MAEQITDPTLHFHVSKVTEKYLVGVLMIKWLESGGRFNKCVHYDMTQRETTQLCIG